MRRRYQQLISVSSRGVRSPARPCSRAAKRLIQQCTIGINQHPILAPTNDWRQKSEHAAATGSEIHQTRTPRQKLGQALCQCEAARGMIERLAQRQPLSVEAFDHKLSAWANSRT